MTLRWRLRKRQHSRVSNGFRSGRGTLAVSGISLPSLLDEEKAARDQWLKMNVEATFVSRLAVLEYGGRPLGFSMIAAPVYLSCSSPRPLPFLTLIRSLWAPLATTSY